MELKNELKVGDEIEIGIAPFCEFPAETTDGKPITQRFTKEAFDKVVENWKNEGEKLIRADFDHASELTDNTIASGWLKDLRVDDEKGLIGTLVVSESGAEKLNGLDYRFGSPVFEFDSDETPVKLVSFALTNRPRLKELPAVYNFEPRKENNEKFDNAPNIETETIEVTEKTNDGKDEKEKIIMDEIKVILGLPPEAEKEDVKAAIRELVENVKTIADEEIADEAEETMNDCGITDEKQREEVANSYKANPALVKAVLNAVKPLINKPLVCNAAEASKPELASVEKLRAEYRNLPGGKEKVEWLLNHPGFTL